MDKETWRFINTFAPWLSAMGTLIAVITSLYLARRGDRLALKISLGVRMIAVRGGGPEHGKEVIWLSATNVGRRAATITNLHWQPFPWRKQGLIWLVPENAYSSTFPITLTDGQMANYVLESNKFRKNFIDFARAHYVGIFGLLWLRLLRIKVYTSTGAVFGAKPEKPLRQLLRALSQEHD